MCKWLVLEDVRSCSFYRGQIWLKNEEDPEQDVCIPIFKVSWIPLLILESWITMLLFRTIQSNRGDSWNYEQGGKLKIGLLDQQRCWWIWAWACVIGQCLSTLHLGREKAFGCLFYCDLSFCHHSVNQAIISTSEWMLMGCKPVSFDFSDACVTVLYYCNLIAFHAGIMNG